MTNFLIYYDSFRYKYSKYSDFQFQNLDLDVSLLKTSILKEYNYHWIHFKLGLPDIHTPHELIQFATKILGNHQELLNKVNNLQEVVDELKIKNESLVIQSSTLSYDEQI